MQRFEAFYTDKSGVEHECDICRPAEFGTWVGAVDALDLEAENAALRAQVESVRLTWATAASKAGAEITALREKLAAAEARTVPAQALTPQSAVEKMLETNQLDELGAEVARLQTALCFWLPSVTDREDEVAIRILDDAFLLVGIDGNLPSDFKSAQELGWIHLAASAAPTAQEDGS